MRGHGFEREAGLEIGCDPSRAEHVAAELDLKPGIGGSPADQAVGIDPCIGLSVNRPVLPIAERKGAFALVADPGCGARTRRYRL
jgi:hypothetical protein